MKKYLSLAYGAICYLAFLGTILYAIGFVGNMFVPVSIDGIPVKPLWEAVAINAALLLVFALQHSIMARPAFKTWWTRYVPKHLERSTYVLFASVCLIILMWQWQPIGGIVWTVNSEFLTSLLLIAYFTGWGIVFMSTFLINHFDLFGLRQTWLQFQGKPYTELPFRVPVFYRIVRHPLYLGFLIAFWAAPVMSVAHFLFAVLTTGYILTAIRFEERDLISHFGLKYTRYKSQIPMIIPFVRGKSKSKKVS